MDKNLIWISLLLNLAGAIAVLRPAYAQLNFPQLRTSRVFFWLLALIPFAAWALTLPSNAPFSSGQALGRGFLFGSLSSFAAFAPFLLGEPGSDRKHTRGFAGFLTGLAAVCAALLFLQPDQVDGIMGVILGLVVESAVVCVSLLFRGLQGYAVPAIASQCSLSFCAAAAALLGVFRGGPDGEPLKWAACTIAMATVLGLLGSLSQLPGSLLVGIGSRLPGVGLLTGAAGRLIRGQHAHNLGGIGIALLVTLIGGAAGTAIASRFEGASSASWCLWAGLGAGWLVWWVRTENPDSIGNAGELLSTLVLIAMAVVAYSKLAGIGVALAGMGCCVVLCLPLALAHGEMDGESALRDFLCGLATTTAFVAAFAAYRIISTRFSADLRGAGFADQFALISILLGASLPFALSAAASRVVTRRRASIMASLAALIVTGSALLGIPAISLLLWGSKSALGLVTGVALGLALRPSSSKHGPTPLAALYALLMSAALAQWTHHILALEELTREQRARWATWTVVVLALGYGLVQFFDHVAQQRESRLETRQ